MRHVLRQTFLGALVAVLCATQAFAGPLGIGLSLWTGSRGAGGGFQYSLLAALNPSSAQVLTATTGTTLTQVATSAVTVPLYTDTSGATANLTTVPAGYPVTPYARISYDTANGAALGPELWDGAFSSTGAGWTANGDGTWTTDGQLTLLQDANKVTIGKRYRWVYEITNVTVAGTGVKFYSGSTDGGEYRSAVGTYTADFNATNTAIAFFSFNFQGTVKPISVKEITPAYAALNSLSGSLGTAAVLSSGLTKYTGGNAANPALAVLAEPAATNAVFHSSDFSGWSLIGSTTVTGGQAGDPFGGSNATLLSVQNVGGDGAIQITKGATLTASVPNTYSVYMKAGTLEWGYLSMVNYTGVTNGGVSFNLSTGAVGTAASGYTGRTQSMGNGWWRCSITVTLSTDVSGLVQVNAGDGDADNIVVQNGTNGIYIYGAQAEASSVPTSYIATTTASVTRAARYTTAVGSEFGTNTRGQLVLNELGREQWVLGNTHASDGGLYVSSANKLVWRGQSLGADVLGGKGTFDDAAYWTAGTGWAVTGGKANFTAGTASRLQKASLCTVGKTYKITYTIDSISGSYVNAEWGTTGLEASRNAAGTYTTISRCTNTTFSIYAAVGTTAVIDNLTIEEYKELTSTDALVAGTIYDFGVSNDTSGATLYIAGTAVATDATMTTPMTWSTVRVGADGAATAARVLNGYTAVLHSSNDAIAGIVPNEGPLAPEDVTSASSIDDVVLTEAVADGEATVWTENFTNLDNWTNPIDSANAFSIVGGKARSSASGLSVMRRDAVVGRKCSVEAKITRIGITASPRLYLIGGTSVVSDQQGYVFWWNYGDGKLYITRQGTLGGGAAHVTSKVFTNTQGVEYTYKGELLADGTINLYVNGNLELTANDNTYTNFNYAVVYAENTSQIDFDDVVVKN